MSEPNTTAFKLRGLSVRLLAAVVVLLLLGEVLIYVPSISRFRVVFLQERLAAAHLASLTLVAAERGVPADLEQELLRHAGVRAVVLRHERVELMLGKIAAVDAVYDLAHEQPWDMIPNAFLTMFGGGERTIRVFGPSPADDMVLVDIALDDAEMVAEMLAYSERILLLSLVLSLIVALFLFAFLQRTMIAPLRRVAEGIVRFREHPERAAGLLEPTSRGDEIGLVQNELASMQRRLQEALHQKTRLAALGEAVSKINHDLRNLLATAMLMSERLERSQDEDTRKVAPRLVEAMERAAKLCAETLAFARSAPPEPRLERFALRAFADQVAEPLIGTASSVVWRNDIAEGTTVRADRDMLHRLLGNLVNNSVNGMGDDGGLVAINAWRDGRNLLIEVADTGPGIPLAAREHLFEAFRGSGRKGGTGLGLAIAQDVARSHGGGLALAATGDDGTVFHLRLPDA